MHNNNPYASSVSDAGDKDDRDLLDLANRLVECRESRPTYLSMIRRWRAFPALLAMGVIGVVLLRWLAADADLSFLQHSPTFIGAMIFGAILRDFANIRRFVRNWHAWNEVIDWDKVELIAR